MKPLVGAEIQRRKINIGRGGDRVGGSFTLVTCLTELRLGASFHAVILDLPSKEPK
jgi:hypothetical protein